MLLLGLNMQLFFPDKLAPRGQFLYYSMMGEKNLGFLLLEKEGEFQEQRSS